MPRLTKSIPSYLLHKPSGRALVNLDGRDLYLGKHGTSVAGQRCGRTEAREKVPILPVKVEDVDITLHHVRPTIAPMVAVQRLTGMRPAEGSSGFVFSPRESEADRQVEQRTNRGSPMTPS
jgi:hypothetical protein